MSLEITDYLRGRLMSRLKYIDRECWYKIRFVRQLYTFLLKQVRSDDIVRAIFVRAFTMLPHPNLKPKVVYISPVIYPQHSSIYILSVDGGVLWMGRISESREEALNSCLYMSLRNYKKKWKFISTAKRPKHLRRRHLSVPLYSYSPLPPEPLAGTDHHWEPSHFVT